MHRAEEPAVSRAFSADRLRALMAEWRDCCKMAGTVVTDAAPWGYFAKYFLHIAPQERTVIAAELA